MTDNIMPAKDDKALIMRILYKVSKGDGPYSISEPTLFRELDNLLERLSDGVTQLGLSDKTQR